MELLFYSPEKLAQQSMGGGGSHNDEKIIDNLLKLSYGRVLSSESSYSILFKTVEYKDRHCVFAQCQLLYFMSS